MALFSTLEFASNTIVSYRELRNNDNDSNDTNNVNVNNVNVNVKCRNTKWAKNETLLVRPTAANVQDKIKWISLKRS